MEHHDTNPHTTVQTATEERAGSDLCDQLSAALAPSARGIFGSSFFDASTGFTFELHHPLEAPELWDAYLRGGDARYAEHGVAGVLNAEGIAAGVNVGLFIVVRDDEGGVVGGIRFEGPLTSAGESKVLGEMAGSEEMGFLVDQVAQWVDTEAVIETKGAWTKLRGAGMARSLSRCSLHALAFLGADRAIASVAEVRLKVPTGDSGARMLGTQSAPFPSEDLRSIFIYWDKTPVGAISLEQARLFLDESAQLAGQLAVLDETVVVPLPGNAPADVNLRERFGSAGIVARATAPLQVTTLAA